MKFVLYIGLEMNQIEHSHPKNGSKWIDSHKIKMFKDFHKIFYWGCFLEQKGTRGGAESAEKPTHFRGTVV